MLLFPDSYRESNHIHLLMRSNIGKLSDTIREFKSFTAKQILFAIDTEASVLSDM
jgi:hypothetical protein